MELYNKRPASDRVEFVPMTEGGPLNPWSRVRDDFGWRARYPRPDIWSDCNWVNRLAGSYPALPAACDRIFGLGSLYAIVSCPDDTVVYLGMAGDTPPQFEVMGHLKKFGLPTVVQVGGQPEYRFAGHRWRAPGSEAWQAAQRLVEAGAFYVFFMVNVKRWGIFGNPYAPPRRDPSPYKCIAADLEAWVMAKGGRPVLNTQNPGAFRPVDSEAPWGT